MQHMLFFVFLKKKPKINTAWNSKQTPLQSSSVVQPTQMSATSFFIVVCVGVVGCDCAHVQHWSAPLT